MKIFKKIIFFIFWTQVIFVFLLFSSCAGVSKIGKPLTEKLLDGIYEGSYSGFPNKAVVKVTIENNKIVDIEIVKHRELMGGKAEGIIPERIIEQQRTDVDVVTGATNSSLVIMNAVQKAVEKAYPPGP